MNQRNKQILSLELVWWIVTVIVAFLVVRPILNNFTEFKFIWLNIYFVALFITYARHIFLLPYTFLANNEKVKVFLIFFAIPLVFFTTQMVWEFQNYVDNGGHDSMFDYLKTSLSDADRKGLYNYIHTEMLFFGVGSIIVGVLLPLRMVLSIWRGRNRGTI